MKALALFRNVWATACLVALPAVVAAQSAGHSSYQQSQAVSGTVRVCGSPQMGALLQLYEAGFTKVQPLVRFNNQLNSTLSAVQDVYAGKAEIGLLGREIWTSEVSAFRSVKRHPPIVVEVATGSYDVPKATYALMIFVQKDNPITSLSTGQLDRIFASGDQPVRTWGELGLQGEWASRPIHLYGFSVDNDKSLVFSQLVFRAGQSWNPAMHEFANEAGPNGADAGDLIVRAIANDPDGVGISNVHYANSGVKELALSTPGHRAVPPTRENVASRAYPLTRAVYMVLDADAAHPPSAAVVEFLRYVLSQQGQQAVRQEGNYIPLTPKIAYQQLQQLPAGPR